MLHRGLLAVALVGSTLAAFAAADVVHAQTRQTTVDPEDAKASQPKKTRKRAQTGKAVVAEPAETPAAAPAKRPLISNDGKLTLGGAIRARFDTRFNSGPSFQSSHLSFDTLAFKLKYDSSTFFGAAQWRFYGGSFIYGHKNGYEKYPGEVQFPMWAYGGYKITGQDSIVAGINQAPFGLTPYYGTSFIESLGFAQGLEEVYNLGVKYSHADERWTWDVGFYPTAAPDAIGISRDSARYSANMVKADSYVPHGSNNHERNMVVGRVEHTFFKNDVASFTGGLSAWWSQVHNLDNGRDGRKNLEAVHFNATWNNWGFKGIYVRQDIKAKNPGRDDMITIGGYDASYNLATRGNFFSGEVNYKIQQPIGGFDLMPYLNYSAFVKDKAAFKTSERYILGVAWTWKKDPRLVIYSEGILGKNDPYVGAGQFTGGLAQGGDDKWKKAIIVNVGFYF